MINVQYPFLDLTKALLTLIQKLKPTDGNKITLFKNYKINRLANHLLKIHISILGQPGKIFELDLKDIDTSVDLHVSSGNIKELELLLNSKITLNPNKEEYCYSWFLQQYIRQALNNQELLKSSFYFPVINTVMQNLESHYQPIEADLDTLIKIEVVGEAGGKWLIRKSDCGWESTKSEKKGTITTVYIDQQIAWLLFAGALHINEIGQFYQIIGNKQLGGHFLKMRSNILL